MQLNSPTPNSQLPAPNLNLKVAIVCDWLTGIGGAERVVLELHRMYPEAPIYTSQYDPRKIDWFKDADVRTGWLQTFPARLKKLLPMFRALYFSRLDLSAYDLVISSSGAEAKGIKTGPDTMHISYCHSPTHYYWTRYDEYLRDPGFGTLNIFAKLALRLFVGPMRRWDYTAAQRPDLLIANSTYTQKNIKRYYGRDSRVVHPPVDTKRFRPADGLPRHGLLTAGRQTFYKRIDLPVLAATKLNLPLTVIGNGPDHNRLRALAGPTVEFLTNVSDDEMPGYFRRAEAFIFPNADDFGIVAVEALAAGTPVIAYQDGGALDYITPGQTGAFFTPQTVEALIETLEHLRLTDYDHSIVARNAQQYDAATFKSQLTEQVSNILRSEQ